METHKSERRWLPPPVLAVAREQAEALVERLAGIPVHVNLIRLNATPDYVGQPSSLEAIETFTAVLDRHHIPHTMRQRRGGAIAAGCGQLRCRGPRGGARETSGDRA